jgi:hypothetical protein
MSASRRGWSCLVAASVAIALAVPAEAARIQLIYVGADNCGPCKNWELFSEPAWRKSPEAKQVELRKVKVPFFINTASDSAWPEDLRWVRDRTNARSGTPRFIVVVDDRVVGTAFGTNGWSQRTVPLLARLVADQSAMAARPPRTEPGTADDDGEMPATRD